MREFFYHGFWRMDWGFGNPNKTAALIAILMIAVWGAAYLHRWGFWVSLVLFTGLGICQIHTYSRGGILSVCIGLGILLWRLPRPWLLSRVIAVVVSFWMILGTSIYLQAYDRYGQGIEGKDQSISHRIEMWKETPRMMVDAPLGWGIGNSGRAYMQWYQPLDHNEKYRTLVSSHLTWMVEIGWPLRFLYLCGWFAVLIVCFPSSKGWQSIPFCIWITFLVAALFSSIAESIWLWIVPVASLFVALGVRFLNKNWPQWQTWLIPVASAIVVLIGLFICGSRQGSPTIRRSPHEIIIGSGTPGTWVLIDVQVLSKNYGRKIRRWLPSSSSIGFVRSAADLKPVGGETIVVCGNQKPDELLHLQTILPRFGKIILLNPYFYPQQLSVDPSKTSVIFSEFSESPSADSWSRVLGESVIQVAGIADYIDRWPQFIFPKSE